MREIELMFKLPLYYSFREFGKPAILPFNYTLSLTYRCNSRCKTCNIWKLQKKIPIENELSADEWIKTIKSFGKTPFWVILSGGEPFLKEGLEDIFYAIKKYNKPRVITIPTNGLTDSSKRIKEILENLNEGIQLVINFSLDGIRTLHDFIRGVKGNWESFLKVYRHVKALKKDYENLTIGIHTVISKWNVSKMSSIYSYVKDKLKPDDYITEIAEKRKELDNLQANIAPSPKAYAQTINKLIESISKNHWEGLGKVTEAFRLEYYKYVRDVIAGRKEYIPSYAGFASVHITPLGEVWDCAIYGNELGRLKDFDYNFKKLWKSERAKKIREKIKSEHKCILASEFYSNSLFSPRILFAVLKNLVSTTL